MYSFSVPLPEERTPWEIPFLDRLSKLTNDLLLKKKHVLTIYEQADTSTFRYRVYNIYQYLKESELFTYNYFFQNEIEQIAKYIPQIQILVISRACWTLEIQNITSVAKLYNIPVVFDVDDRVFDIDYLQLLTNTLNVTLKHPNEYNFWFAHISRIQKTASLADYFTCTNPYLGQALSKKFGKKYFCVENSLNKEQLEVSAKVCEIKSNAINDEDYVIGYFSGTPSHINDFKVLAPEIIRLLKEYPAMKLLVVGFMEFPASMNSYIKAGRILTHKLVDFIELQVLMAQVDVNIVPLVNNEFTNCKSELKFFDAAIVDTISCATPIYTYANSIKHGETGFLCEQGDWYKTISDLYNGKYDTKKICKNAKEYCLNCYSGAVFLKKLETTYTNILEGEK